MTLKELVYLNVKYRTDTPLEIIHDNGEIENGLASEFTHGYLSEIKVRFFDENRIWVCD